MKKLKEELKKFNEEMAKKHFWFMPLSEEDIDEYIKDRLNGKIK